MPAGLVAMTAAVLGLSVLPTRAYLEKRDELQEAESRLADLRLANAEAQATADRLDSDAELERLAREQFGLARPGEETYVVLPPPEDPVRLPRGWPFDRLAPPLDATG